MAGSGELVRLDAIWHNEVADAQNTLTGEWTRVLLPQKPGLVYEVGDVYEMDYENDILVVPGGVSPREIYRQKQAAKTKEEKD